MVPQLLGPMVSRPPAPMVPQPSTLMVPRSPTPMVPRLLTPMVPRPQTPMVPHPLARLVSWPLTSMVPAMCPGRMWNDNELVHRLTKGVDDAIRGGGLSLGCSHACEDIIASIMERNAHRRDMPLGTCALKTSPLSQNLSQNLS